MLISKIVTDVIYMLIDPRIDFDSSVVNLVQSSVDAKKPFLVKIGEAFQSLVKAIFAVTKIIQIPIFVIQLLRGKIKLHPNTVKRFQRFKQRKAAWISFWFISILFCFSLVAECFINDSPLAIQYQGEVYFPAFKRYSPTEFGIQNTFVVDYRALIAEDKNVDWTIWFYRYGPLSIHDRLEPPSAEHWLGTDRIGRDILARLVYGFRISMVYALSVCLFGYILGTAIGGVQGFFGGRIDFVVQRITEIWSALPVLYMLIILIAILGQSLWLLILITVIFEWVGISYYMRAEFLKLRQRTFVEAAIAYGARKSSIMFKHILPNGLIPLVTFAPFTISSNITGIAILDYLGLGLPAPTPSWGELMKQALDNFTIAWWLSASIVIAMFVTLLSLVFINEGVRDAFDPRKN